MDAGMDTGNMLEKWSTPIGEDETAGELAASLAQIGAKSVREGLPKYVAGGYVPEVQDHAQMTLAPMLKKEDGRVDFAKPAKAVHDHVRGMSPWPGAHTMLAGKLVKVLATKREEMSRAGAVPGEVILADKSRVVVACAEGSVSLERVQLEGKKPMRGGDWVVGRGVREGDRFGA